MKTIHVISISDTRDLYTAYVAENPQVRYTSYISAMDAVGSLLRISSEFCLVVKVLDLDNLESM